MKEEMEKRIIAGTFNSDMQGPVYTRNSVLMSLCHAKKLLLTHGYESFKHQINGLFDTDSKDGKYVGKKPVITFLR